MGEKAIEKINITISTYFIINDRITVSLRQRKDSTYFGQDYVKGWDGT